ncbi:hypothetical protein [Nocardia transvalensis]|uniref:hypothetical protein n=1 Tax=Nocardia transvalensis TaxID=37333 RepID=UPI0018942EBC|nr:hypothetical protein [Nocardia transvalensis]MBF6329787.1 hypothetical protein [Nocardia transvalensis]
MTRTNGTVIHTNTLLHRLQAPVPQPWRVTAHGLVLPADAHDSVEPAVVDEVDEAVTTLARRVATARAQLPLQDDAALTEVLSEAELAAERELAEWIRAQRRAQRRRAIEAELAAEARDRKAAETIAREQAADARWHRRALAARARVTSADARLAQLYRRAEWSSRALIAVVVLGMVWAAVNVQHNLVPDGNMGNPLYWLSYGIEAMISIPLIAIMLVATTAARWGQAVRRRTVVVFESALLAITIGLNTGPHLVAGQIGRAAEYAVAPLMVGVVIWLHAWVAARYATLIEHAAAAPHPKPQVEPHLAPADRTQPSAVGKQAGQARADHARRLAVEVLQRRPGMTKTVDEVTAVVAEAMAGTAPTTIADRNQLHHTTVRNILAVLDEITGPGLRGRS